MLQSQQPIDVSVPDQGLAQILQAVSLQDPVTKYLTEACAVKNTTDLLMYFSKATYEAEIKEVIAGKFVIAEGLPVELQRLYISRTRAAFKLAIDTDNKVQAEANKPPPPQDADHPDLERPLDAATIEKLDAGWTELHKWKFISHMRPAPQFRDRVFRQLRTMGAKLIPVEKAKSMEETRIASEPIELPIGESGSDGAKLIYQTAHKTSRQIHNSLEYVTALRVVMNTYAYCGSHKVTAKDDESKTIVFFPWEVALGYVDEVTMAILAMTLHTEADKVVWVRRRDEQVRSEMVALINDGFSGGEALKTAWTKFAHMWIMRDTAGVATSSADDHQDQRGQVRGRDGPTGKGKGKEDKRPRQQAPDYAGQVKTGTKDRYGRKFCGAYNAKKGCSRHEKDCPQRGKHLCNVVMPNGDLCQSSRHIASTHNSSS